MTLPELDFARLDSEADEEWTEPTLTGESMDDFGLPAGTDLADLPPAQRAEVRDNYLYADDPVETLDDLKLPVVDPEGSLDPDDDSLSEAGLHAADARLNQTEGIPADERARIQAKIDRLQERFE